MVSAGKVFRTLSSHCSFVPRRFQDLKGTKWTLQGTNLIPTGRKRLYKHKRLFRAQIPYKAHTNTRPHLGGNFKHLEVTYAVGWESMLRFAVEGFGRKQMQAQEISADAILCKYNNHVAQATP